MPSTAAPAVHTEGAMQKFCQALTVAAMVAVVIGTGHGPVRAQNFALPALTQRYFRVDTEPAQTKHGRLVLRGYLYNLFPYGVGNVRLSVEALDAGGQPVGASTSGWVNGDIETNGRRYFEVPAPAAAASYRVTVESYDLRFSDRNG